MNDIIQNYSLSVVRATIAHYLDRPAYEIEPYLMLGPDLGFDLIDTAVLAMRIEDQMHIDLRISELDDVLTVEEVAEIVAEQLESKVRRVA